jgi:hypothetical protein
MVDLIRTIGDSRDLIQDWEVTGQPGGVLVRLRSRASYETTDAATAAGQALIGWLLEAGYELLVEPVVRARRDETRGSGGWQAWVELVLRRRSAQGLQRAASS